MKQHKRAFSGLHFPTTLPVPNTHRWNRRPFDTSDVMAEIREEPHDHPNQVINRYYLYLLFFSQHLCIQGSFLKTTFGKSMFHKPIRCNSRLNSKIGLFKKANRKLRLWEFLHKFQFWGHACVHACMCVCICVCVCVHMCESGSLVWTFLSVCTSY